ncbi:MAG TPA: tRNA (adenosine(37)-N6)-threonylcarbamoyltransferase complex ATPase subunit type 1 TsaE [Phycisphaerae bacterium]|nr:tRNA (adenosine(37)-N6)-threonylcarbamoyltransferase complex ATPase subunit type 1 TsaE [Phycisphaerae bacterium]
MSPPQQRRITSTSVEQTLAIGRGLGAALQNGDVLALIGPLGAGKTQLVKGIAAGLGVIDLRKVNSPTFVLVNEYQGRLHLYHIDVYRLRHGSELQALGFDEMCLASDAAVVIEWADRVEDVLPDNYVGIHLHVAGADRRELVLEANGRGCGHLLASLDSTGIAF